MYRKFYIVVIVKKNLSVIKSVINMQEYAVS